MTKFRITMKDPDGVYECVRDHAKELAAQAKSNPAVAELAPGDWELQFHESIIQKIKRWVEYSEYMTIEFDTIANTATVMEVGK